MTRSTIETRIDGLLGGRVQLEQPVRGYRVAIDPVLLAAAVPARAGDHVLDVGAGSGAVTLCLLARVPGIRVVALERDLELFRLLCRNIDRNGVAADVEAVQGDIAQPPASVGRRGFDLVVTNPPYGPAGRGTPPPGSARAAAAVESLPLGEWIAACCRRLAPGGFFVMIHRAGRVDEIAFYLRGCCGSVRIFPLWPSAQAPEARRVIVLGRKGSAGEAHLLRGLVLHDGGRRFTPEAEAILRQAQGIAGLADLRAAGRPSGGNG